MWMNLRWLEHLLNKNWVIDFEGNQFFAVVVELAWKVIESSVLYFLPNF